MCGIAGVIGAKEQKNVLVRMTDSQKHRGPDHTGIWISDEVGLGHNRLSIIDLSEDAYQPCSWPKN